jgi:hypothetical protein
LGYRYQLRTRDGGDSGEVEYPDGGIKAGDEIRIAGNVRMRVHAVVPVELVEEFVDRTLYGILEVGPLPSGERG